MLNKFKILFFTLTFLFSNISYAEDKPDVLDNDYDSNDYDASYYEDEGNLLFKVRGTGILTSGKQKKLPDPIVSPSVSVGGLVKNGYGADTATTIFFNDNIGVELSLGFYALKTKTSSLVDLTYNYQSNVTPAKRKDVYMIPLNFAPQFHIAPFGGLRPYVGGGFTAAYLFTKSKEFKVKNGFGSFLQAGIDLIAKDDTLITLDIKQYYYKPKISYNNSFIKKQKVTSRVDLNPLLISFGVGFKL